MNTITRELAMQALELLEHSEGTNIDYITMWANTNHQLMVCYNPYMDGGRWEFADCDGSIVNVAVSIDIAANYITSIDAHVRATAQQ